MGHRWLLQARNMSVHPVPMDAFSRKSGTPSIAATVDPSTAPTRSGYSHHSDLFQPREIASYGGYINVKKR